MEISQGDIFWLDPGVPQGSVPGYRRPFVVIQNDIFNRSGIHTTIVCALTTNLNWAGAPGNVLLRKGEAHLPKASVVNVSQIYTADKKSLVQKIGTLSSRRLREVLSGVFQMFEPRKLQ